MYPGTIFNWYDQSYINTQSASEAEFAPLFLTASSFDKGPEDMRIVSGDNFYKLYGTPSFTRHGQPAIQAARIIDAGGRLLIKRLVADDATLANIILVSTVKTEIIATPDTTNSEDAKTLNQILGKDTSTDTEATTRYLTESKSTAKWTSVSVSGVKTYNEVVKEAEKLFVENELTASEPDASGVVTISGSSDYPLFIVVDNGRGVSNKSMRLVSSFNVSKNMNFFFYDLQIFDGTTVIDKQSATLDPNSLVNGTNFSFDDEISDQLKFYTIPGVYKKFLANVAAIAGVSEKVANTYDLVFMKTNRKGKIPNIEIAEDSIDIGSEYGVPLANGENGEFGDAPFGTKAYEDQAVNFFNGTTDDSIFDKDDFKICAVFDANYPLAVKETIADLVTFREDFFYFRDLGLDVSSYMSIIEAENQFHTYNRYVGDYLTTYEVYNPENDKRIRVTMMYDMAPIMVNHFINGSYRPIAGIANNMILPSAIKGTVNFTPRITPTVNQKSLLEDARINYAIFQQDQCVIQSLYTSQEPYTQLSYINNVLAIQEVARAVRTACPKVRYTFASGSDFSIYAEAVNKVLSNYSSNFAELGFEYQQNAVQAAQKIFYAVLTFRFNNWAQTEIFDLFALPTE